MCVTHGDARTALFTRGSFLGAVSAIAAPVIAGPAALAQTLSDDRYPLPAATGRPSSGNLHAMTLAQKSPLVRSVYARVESLARSIRDPELRDQIVGMLHDPRPQYARRYRTDAERAAVRDALARAGYVKADAPVAGIFPTGNQPFWSAPGSGEGSHHAYPGGLAMHEYFNASLSESIAAQYDREYFGGTATIDRDMVIGAALYHDISKTVVFGWNDDGTLFDELTIADTGGHHVLSGAEAIARGRSPVFVTTLLSAHAAPSLGDERKVAAWCRAAAIVAGVDPVDYGLVKRDGSLAADAVPIEAFINNLSDHDYTLSVHAMHAVSDRLKTRYATIAPMLAGSPASSFPWYRSAILTKTTALALYDVLARRGEAAFTQSLGRVEGSVRD